MLVVLVKVSLSKTEVDHSYLVESFLVVRVLWSITNYNVVKFQIIIKETGLMDKF